MFDKVAVIGLGEAGTILAQIFRAVGVKDLRAYDILLHDRDGCPALRNRAESAGVRLCRSSPEAVTGSDIILSTVTADQAAVAACAAAAGLAVRQIYLDLNSTSPAIKKEGAAAVFQAGADFVDGVAMDTLPRCGITVPLLLAGPKAEWLSGRLNRLGLKTEAIGDEVGLACTVKMLRSIVVKGIEAILTECVLGAAKVGEIERVLESLNYTYPGLDWQEMARYHMERLAIHGARRAKEMDAVVDTLESLDVAPILARAVAARQQWSADLNLNARLAGGDKPTIEDILGAVAAPAKSDRERN